MIHWNLPTPLKARGTRLMAICLAGWAIVGLIFYAQDVSRRMFMDDPRPWQEWAYWTIRIVFSAALTPLILWAGRRWTLDRHTWIRHLFPHVLLSLCFASLRMALELMAHLLLLESGLLGVAPEWIPSWDHVASVLMIFGIPSGVIAYWVVLIAQAAFVYREKLTARELHEAELRAQVARARLDALKVQLQPHFLFNTLNAIVVLVREHSSIQAEEALTQLSDLLRAVLDNIDVQEVPLSRELDYVKLYLSIQQMRFSDRLKIRIDADPDVLDAAVPHMGLQPVVENAIHHGIARRTGGTIQIEAHRDRDQLCILVKDDGAGVVHTGSNAGWGLGLSNLRARLLQLYGPAAQLEILSSATDTRVRLVLPFRICPMRHQDEAIGKFAHATHEQ